MTARVQVTVEPSTISPAVDRLFAALSLAFPVEFLGGGETEPCDGHLVLGRDPVVSGVQDLAALGKPVLALAAAPEERRPPQRVTLTASDHIDRRLRDVSLSGQELARAPEVAPADEVLALADSRPSWVRTPAQDGPIDRVASAVPGLGPAEVLRDAIYGPRALAMVALVQFVRAIGAAHDLDTPPTRAAVIFDDPNLRRPTYGFIRYEELVRHADDHHYHASMAMIPLDARAPSAEAVALFRDRGDRVSLSFHGNNHEKRELLQPAHLPEALALCAQALRRITRFEARSGLAVDRVMIPPHGLCSRETARALGAVGFDALCAIHPHPWEARPPADRPLAGWEPATFVEGCAVLPRVPLRNEPTDLALRAFLDQPVIIYGHHEDVAAGLAPLAAAAANVNRLGDVRWMSLGAIARSNVRSRYDDRTLTVRPYANRVTVTPTQDAEQLVVLPPAGSDGFSSWSVASRPTLRVPLGDAQPCAGGTPVTVRLHSRAEVDPDEIGMPARRPWPALRRAGTEIRDRLAPLRR